MAFYTMRYMQDRAGGKRIYQSNDGRLIVCVSARRYGRRHEKGPALLIETCYEDERGGGWNWFSPLRLWHGDTFEDNTERIYEVDDFEASHHVYERALVAESGAMYRDGIKRYEASGWTPCEVTPECLEYWMRYRRGEAQLDL